MHRLLAAAVVVSSISFAAAAWACGAPLEVAPGRAGTALAEGKNQISVFVANDTGYSWDRLQGPSWARTHVLDIYGSLDGNIETDARVQRAIASQNGGVVEVSSSGVSPISSAAEAKTTVFGAALDSMQGWQVLAYDPDNQRLALFSESGSPGYFTEVSAISASCGQPEMLDVLVEPGDTTVGLCSGKAVLVANGQLQLADLPMPALALGRASNGTAVFYGRAKTGTELVRMQRSGASWAVDSTVDTGGLPVQWLIPVSETSILVNSGSSFSAFTLVDGVWKSSSTLDGSTPVTSAFGAPAQVLGGQYELTLYASVDDAWQSTDLGPMGTQPIYGGSSGCESAGGMPLAPLFAIALLLLRRTRLA